MDEEGFHDSFSTCYTSGTMLMLTNIWPFPSKNLGK
jgi:hypothetical protein